MYCHCCKEQKPEDQFPFRNKNKGQRHTNCKVCMRKRSADWYKNNKEHHVSNILKRKHELKDEAIDYIKNLELKCNRCNENHPAVLDFHHSDPNGKEFGIAMMIGNYTLDRLIKEIEKCEVLCSNCHRIHHYNERN